MMGRHLMLIVLLLTSLFYDSVCLGQLLTDINLQVEGNAPVIKNDVARARAEAVKNALEKAMMQAAAKVLSERYDDEKLQAIKSMMIGKVDRYVKNYRMISEMRQHDDYAVNVHVVVALAPVREDLLQMGVLQDQRAKDSVPVALSLKGVKKYSDFTRIKMFLQNRPKIVKSIYPCRLERQQVHCDLVVVGSVRDLAVELEKTGRYILETPEKNQDIIEINLQIKEEVQ
jgi:hypothetical protein